MTLEVIITCEHGGHRIPRRYAAYFAGAENVLESHRGWDAGALPLARRLAGSLGVKLFYSTTSRLLVDLNRSEGHPRHFSEYSRPLSREQKESITAEYYTPHRTQVCEAIASLIRRRKMVLHVSVHSFTPLFEGRVRKTDIGLLYDPHRESEVRFVSSWRKKIEHFRRSDLTIHRNQPYRGISDGFTCDLRTRFPNEQYLGIELEVSQKWLTGKDRFTRPIETLICDSLYSTIREW